MRERPGGGRLIAARTVVYWTGLMECISKDQGLWRRKWSWGVKRTPILPWFSWNMRNKMVSLKAMVSSGKTAKFWWKQAREMNVQRRRWRWTFRGGICWWWTKNSKGYSEVWEACKVWVIGTRLGDKQEINTGISTMDMNSRTSVFFSPIVNEKIHIIFTILNIFKCTFQWY